MNYYENEHGRDLREFFLTHTPQLWAMFCSVNMLKYQVRAGRKAGESEMKDMNKFDDYLKDYCAINGLTKSEAVEKINEVIEEFKKYE